MENAIQGQGYAHAESPSVGCLLGKRVAAGVPEGAGPAISKLRTTLKQLELSLDNLAEAERRRDGLEKTLRQSGAASTTTTSRLGLDDMDEMIQRSLDAIPSTVLSSVSSSTDTGLHTKQQLRIRELEAQVENLALQARDATSRLQEERLNKQYQESLLKSLQQK
jgi:hypothetical protein